MHLCSTHTCTCLWPMTLQCFAWTNSTFAIASWMSYCHKLIIVHCPSYWTIGVVLPNLASGHDAHTCVHAVYVHAPFFSCASIPCTRFSIFTSRQWRSKNSIYPLYIQHASYKVIRRSKICAAQHYNDLHSSPVRHYIRVGSCSFHLHCILCQGYCRIYGLHVHSCMYLYL